MSNTKPKTEVVKHENVSAESLISQAIQQKVDVDMMERIFGLREKIKAEQAKEAFTHAIAKFQNDCPIIEKTKKVLNKDGSVRYLYAPLDAIVEQIKKPLAKHGLSYRWEVTNDSSIITATAIVTHSAGHSEQSNFSVPIEESQYMTSPQRYASALTYAKRYSLCSVLGIATADEDTDATDVKKPVDALSPKSKIIFLLRTLGEETKDKEVIVKKVKELTNLKLDERNFDEIIGRLEVLVKEKQEYENSKV